MTAAISVIVPTYNRGAYLRRTIDSVLKACADLDEIIVVDAALNRDAEVLIDGYGNPKLKYVRQINQGVSAARNYGLDLARNDLIAYIDDDDEWHPQKLNVQRALLAKYPEAVGCFTNIWATTVNGEMMSDYLFQWGQPVQDWNQLLGETRTFSLHGFDQEIHYYLGDHYFNQMLDDYVLPSSLLIDRSKFKENLRYRVGMQRNESWLYTSQVCRQGPVIYVDLDLAGHHGDAPNRLTSVSQIETVLSRLYVLENEFGRRSEFLKEHQAAFDQRLARECDLLFSSVMAGGVEDRRKVLRENAHYGGRLAFAARMPEMGLSLASIAIRLVSRLRRLSNKRNGSRPTQ
ncbi:glycosyltransferase family 2 protein [Myxococcota bacterium]|nr:glycosyltransferase family 2 protein [Myxococcota bacterium]